MGDRALGLLLLLGGLIGAVAAFVLTLERIALLEDPTSTPSCDLSPVLSCGSVMRTEQAAAFGFPNPLIGLAAFPVVATTGAALLAGARLARWYWLGLQVGVTAGVALVGWLVFQSLYRIGALCPYCLAVWAVVVPIAWYVTVANLRAGRLPGASTAVGRAAVANHAVVLTLVVALVAALVAQRFWDYWVGLVV